MNISLVIPCYNEDKNIPLILERCKIFSEYPDIEVILVDNGSTDQTPKILSDLLPIHPYCRSIRVEQNQGYGFGIKSGLESARGDILAWTHADMQTDPQDIIHGAKLFEKFGHQIFVKGLRYGRPWTDVVFTIGMGIFETILLRKRMQDINAQPNMFSRSFYESWSFAPDDFSLDLYVYYEAKRKNLRILRFPVKFGERAYGSSHWNIDIMSKWKFIKRTISFSMDLKRKSPK